jgi:hypothetical protein
MKRKLFCALSIIVLMGAFFWTYFKYTGSLIVARGDIREASYLASDFTAFFIAQNRLPTESEAVAFRTRLKFEKLDGLLYKYRCGYYGRDLLIIERDANGKFQFWVHGESR